MCLFKEYAKPEWGDEITVFSEIFSPLRFRCKDCKLHPEGHGNFRTLIYTEDNIPKKFLERTAYGTANEVTYAQIIMHIEEHVKAGHKVHPKVIGYIYQEQQEAGMWAVYGKKLRQLFSNRP